MTQTLGSKSILAKLMATENITIQQRKVRTASFNLKNRVLTVPILDRNISADIYDLFMGHEVGHALYTPESFGDLINPNKTDNPIPKGILNIIEDARIEKKIKTKYPGLRTSFSRAYKDLFSRNFFETEGKNINKMNLLDRVNLFFKVGADLNISFTNEEMVYVEEIENVQTFEQVVGLSQDLYDYLLSLPETGDDEDEDLGYEYVIGDGWHDSADKQELHGELADPDYDYLSPTQDHSGNPYSTYGEDMQESPDESILPRETVRFDDEKLISTTMVAYEANESTLFEESCRDILHLKIPKMDLESTIVPYKTLYKNYRHYATRYGTLDEPNPDYYDKENYLVFRSENEKMVSFMVKEFELKKNAEQMKKVRIAKSGNLNMQKVFSYKYNDDIFKKNAVVPGGKSHGLVIYVDWSGSMTYQLDSTIKQLFGIVSFCKRSNIPFEVYAFSDAYNNQPFMEAFTFVTSGLKLYNILSSKMTTNELNEASYVLTKMGANPGYTHGVMPMGGTPLNQAVISAFEIVPKFKQEYKLQVVNTVFLTDGEGDRMGSYYNENGLSQYISTYVGKEDTKDIMIIDPVTKEQVYLPIAKFAEGDQQTAAFVTLLKKRTNANVVGFYLLSLGEFKSFMNRYFRNSVDEEKVDKEFKTKNCTFVKKHGFDEYYLLRSSKSSSLDEFSTSHTTNRGIANAFSKYISKRNASQPILSRFINLITNNSF